MTLSQRCEQVNASLIAWSCIDVNSWTPIFVARLSNDNVMLTSGYNFVTT